MKRELYLLALVQILVALSMGIVGPIYSIYFEKISGSLKDVGIIIGIYWIIVGLLEIPFGMLSDKIGKRKVFAIGGILVSSSIFLYPFLSNFYQINANASFLCLASRNDKKERRGLEVGLIDSSWNVVYGIASIVSGMLITVFGFSLIFSLAGVLHFASSVVISKRMKEVS